jgi:sulfur-oxidizing protein SoxZ
MADPMRIRARLQGEKTTVVVQMAHEMETGLRKDAAGKTIPAWHITKFVAQHNGKQILTGDVGPAVSKNPSVRFAIKGAKAGDKVTITWTDNKGEKRTDEATVA